MNGSGPAVQEAAELIVPEPVSLPLLTSLTLGYTSTAAGLALLSLLAAPHLHTLALEDATHPAEILSIDAVPLLARVFPSPAAAPGPLFPALASLALRRAHFDGPLPPARVARLELVATSPAALALESTELRVRGPLASTSVVPRDEALAATGAALRALVEARGAAAAPQTICLHEAAYALREVEEEEFKLGGTRVRVFRRVDGEGEGDGDGDGDDEDTVMGSEPECGWDGEDEAFKVGGVFNDPVFDARYGYVG
jgi:hypothetical protein